MACGGLGSRKVRVRRVAFPFEATSVMFRGNASCWRIEILLVYVDWLEEFFHRDDSLGKYKMDSNDSTSHYVHDKIVV